MPGRLESWDLCHWGERTSELWEPYHREGKGGPANPGRPLTFFPVQDLWACESCYHYGPHLLRKCSRQAAPGSHARQVGGGKGLQRRSRQAGGEAAVLISRFVIGASKFLHVH